MLIGLALFVQNIQIDASKYVVVEYDGMFSGKHNFSPALWITK